MNDMLDRAIKASMFHSNTEDGARAALLAALDETDGTLVDACAVQFGITVPPREEHREIVRSVIRRLRAELEA